MQQRLHASRTRTLPTRSAPTSFLRRAVQQVQRIFHTAMSLVFLALAVGAGAETLAAWRRFQAFPDSGLIRFYIAGGCAVLLILMGLYSLLKARAVR